MAGLIQHNGAGDYASLNAAVAVGAGAITISGDWAGDDTTDVTWGNACTVRISGDSLNKVGKPGRAGGSYRLVKANAGADHVFTVSADLDIWDMDIMSDSSGASDEIFRIGTNEVDVICKRCHIGFSGNVDQQDILYYEGDSQTVEFTFESCIFYDVGRSIIDCFNVGESNVTINFNGCSSINIGADGARGNGCWVGSVSTGGDGVYIINVFNNLITCEDTNAFVFDATDVNTLNADYNITNITAANFVVNDDTFNETGNLYEYVWADDGDPGAGNFVVINDKDVSPYDQRLDDVANNDAIDVHSVETGPNSGLSIPNDIVGTVRGAAENHDVGAFEIPEGAPPSGIEIFRRRIEGY